MQGKKKNVIVGQSGGPTAAINSSLVGVYKTAIDRGADLLSLAAYSGMNPKKMTAFF